VPITVVLPTYNERENIAALLADIRRVVPQAFVLVIDDQSPDGTGDIAEQAAAELGQIEVLHRKSKDGLGSAYRFGFHHLFASKESSGELLSETLGTSDLGQPSIVITMDADFSHDPKVIPELIVAIEAGADAVVGSRYVRGGSTVDWPLHRRLLSRWGNMYTGAILGVRVRDCTSGFRAYRLMALRGIDPHSTSAEGYAFLTELIVRLRRQGRSITEVPITFVDRKYGSSKMSSNIIFESMRLVTRWGIRHRWQQFRSIFTSR
jgi:dolichol-phosphate mannosyltransferase